MASKLLVFNNQLKLCATDGIPGRWKLEDESSRPIHSSQLTLLMGGARFDDVSAADVMAGQLSAREQAASYSGIRV
jgi:hypothetical protein